MKIMDNISTLTVRAHDVQMCFHWQVYRRPYKGRVWLLCFKILCLCVSLSRDYVDKMEEARLAREER